MFLKTLQLQDFRSYPKGLFRFLQEASLIVGNNATGKTNIFEAIELLAIGKSFRAGKETEMIRNGAELARVEATVFSAEKEPLKLEVVLTRGELQGQRVTRKRLLVNGIGKRLFDFAGKLRVVLFNPEDLNLVIGSPSRRRNYLDFVLSQIDRDYYRCSLAYQKGLRRRNKLLLSIREKEAQRSQLEFWNRLLVKNGNLIHQKRDEFIGFINRYCVSSAISQFRGLEVEYDSSVISEERLLRYAQAEIAAAATLVGPHRDDFKILGSPEPGAVAKDLAVYGSRGEQRMAVLALKLAELAYVEEKTGERPLLLLDDIFSELDHAHRDQILSLVDRQQTMITTTDIHLVEPNFRNKMALIQI